MGPPQPVDRRQHVGQGAVRQAGLGRRTRSVQLKRADAVAVRRRKRREIAADGGHTCIIAARQTRMELRPILRDPGSGGFPRATAPRPSRRRPVRPDAQSILLYGASHAASTEAFLAVGRGRCFIWATAGTRFACSMLKSGFGRALLAGESRKGGGVWRLADS